MTFKSLVQVTLMTMQRHLWSSLRGGLPSALVWCPLQPTGTLMTQSISSATAWEGLSCTPRTSFPHPGGQLSALDLAGWGDAAPRWSTFATLHPHDLMGQMGS